jgi:hypothetical protein
LNETDPQLKKDNGIFFTPYPVVSFIVRSIHEILKKCKTGTGENLENLGENKTAIAMGSGMLFGMLFCYFII